MNDTIRFTKMHGLGNDFVVINSIDQPIDRHRLPVKALADRHTGIGFDQLLLIAPSSKADFFCHILNADGSEAEQCGNGLRCVARFLHEEGLHSKQTLTLETIAGTFPVFIKDYDHIQVTLGIPVIDHALFELPLSQHHRQISLVSTGNPHAILRVDQLEERAFVTEGAEIASHPHFVHGVNVGFMQIMNGSHARLRTLERGAGETLACGSNACAAAIAGIINGWLQPSPVNIEFRYGSLLIEWEGEGKPVHMTGPATRVYSGILDNRHQ